MERPRIDSAGALSQAGALCLPGWCPLLARLVPSACQAGPGLLPHIELPKSPATF